ncbi:hypothetical protein Dimus_015365 [Dionaea muscipula]
MTNLHQYHRNSKSYAEVVRRVDFQNVERTGAEVREIRGHRPTMKPDRSGLRLGKSDAMQNGPPIRKRLGRDRVMPSLWKGRKGEYSKDKLSCNNVGKTDFERMTRTPTVRVETIGNGWLYRSAVATFANFRSTDSLFESFMNDSSGNFVVRRLGNKKALITFLSEAKMKSFIEQHNNQSFYWFRTVEPWSVSTDCSYGREVWLSCYGIPAHAWNVSTFCSIGKYWGEVEQIDDDTAKCTRLDVEKVKDFRYSCICHGRNAEEAYPSLMDEDDDDVARIGNGVSSGGESIDSRPVIADSQIMQIENRESERSAQDLDDVAARVHDSIQIEKDNADYGPGLALGLENLEQGEISRRMGEDDLRDSCLEAEVSANKELAIVGLRDLRGGIQTDAVGPVKQPCHSLGPVFNRDGINLEVVILGLGDTNLPGELVDGFTMGCNIPSAAELHDKRDRADGQPDTSRAGSLGRRELEDDVSTVVHSDTDNIVQQVQEAMRQVEHSGDGRPRKRGRPSKKNLILSVAAKVNDKSTLISYRRRLRRMDDERLEADKIWQFGKTLGLTSTEPDVDVVRHIERMIVEKDKGAEPIA